MIRSSGTPSAECAALLREGHLQAALHRAWRLAAPDLADVFALLTPSERRQFLEVMPSRLAARGLVALPHEGGAAALLATLRPAAAAEILRVLDEDKAADLVGAMPAAARELLLATVEKRAAIDNILQYGEHTAGRSMTTALLNVPETDPVPLAVEAVRRQSERVLKGEEIYVVDHARRLVGVLSFRDLVLAAPTQDVRDIMHPPPQGVLPSESRREVMALLQRYHLASLPVLDETGRLLGRVSAEDVVDVAMADAAGTFLRFGGVRGGPETPFRWTDTVRSRLPTLYSNLFTAFLAAAMIHAVVRGSGRLVPLLIWVPIVMGMGGHAGVQALATTLHRLSQGRLQWNRRRRVLGHELLVGMVNGALIGALVGGVVVLLGESWRAGLIVTLTMMLHLPLAGGLAALLPMILRRAGVDPALASAPAVTSILDVLGVLILLGLGLLLL